MNRLESVWIGKDNGLLDAMLDFYAPTASRIIDVCCNERRMWKGSTWGPKVIGYDRDPAMNPDVVCEWHALPDAPGSVDVLVYDPPHMPTAASSPKSLAVYVDSYGLAGSVKADNIDSLHAPFLKEAARVLKDDGLVFAKIKDYIHNHRYQWNLSMFKEKVREAGLTACDLIIKRDPSGGNLKSGRWQRAHHAKNVHCFWVIVRKSHRCEPRMAA
jgi:SAM-dependent methyltransferase